MLGTRDVDFYCCCRGFENAVFGFDFGADGGDEVSVAGYGDVFFCDGLREVWVWDADFNVSLGRAFPFLNVGVIWTRE